MRRALAENESLRRQMGANARRYIQTHHTLEGAARGYLEFIQDVVASPHKPVDVQSFLGWPADDDILAGLIAAVSADMVDIGIVEDNDEILREIAKAVAELGSGAL